MSKQFIYLLLAVSLGLNMGVVGMTLVNRNSTSESGLRPGPMGPNEGRPGQQPDPKTFIEDHMQGITEHLDLSTQQQQEIRSVLEKYSGQLNQFQIEVGEARRNLGQAYAAPEFDSVKIRSLTAENSSVRASLDSLSAVILIAEATVLTPEQRKKYAAVAPSIHSASPPPPRGGQPPHSKHNRPPRR